METGEQEGNRYGFAILSSDNPDPHGQLLLPGVSAIACNHQARLQALIAIQPGAMFWSVQNGRFSHLPVISKPNKTGHANALERLSGLSVAGPGVSRGSARLDSFEKHALMPERVCAAAVRSISVKSIIDVAYTAGTPISNRTDTGLTGFV